MSTTFRNSSMVLSIGSFSTLIILGLAATLPSALLHGLTSQGVPAAGAASATACRQSQCCSRRCLATPCGVPEVCLPCELQR